MGLFLRHYHFFRHLVGVHYVNRHAGSTGHYLTAAENEIPEIGGNDNDAGCTARRVLAVLHIDQVCFAGVAPIIIPMENGEIVTFAGLGHWLMSLPADIFIREHNFAMREIAGDIESFESLLQYLKQQPFTI